MNFLKKTLLTSITGYTLISSSFGAIVASSDITVTTTSEFTNGAGTLIRPVTTVIDYTTLSTPDETGIFGNAASNAVLATVYHTQDATPGAVVTFDFTETQTIDTVFLWNYAASQTNGNNFSNRSVQSFTVELFDSSDVSLGTHDFTAAQGPSVAGTPVSAQSFSLGGIASSVSTVEFTLNSNFGGQFTGFSHAAFGTATIPEPGHFALGFAGIMALAVCLRRRAKKNA